ncbi:MAG: hypothetical protein SCJ93_01765 [Bacillota bacterium]|nr:hypothetical protein [Bacillota bacterium]
MKNEKGSIMVLLILAMMVVVVLGSIVLNITMVSYKMKKTNTSAEKNLYLSEAGLDEVYAAVKLTADAGIQSGNLKVEEFYSSFDIDEEINKEESLFVDENGVVDSEYIKLYTNQIFMDEYKDYVENNLHSRVREENLVVLDEEIDCSIDLYPESSHDLHFDSDGVLDIKVTSEIKNNGVMRATSAVIYINTPDFHNPFKEDRVVKLVDYIPLFDQAIAADKDIYLNGKVYIKGNVFAYGDMYGVALDEEGTNVEIEGNIYTNGSIGLYSNDTILNSNDIYSNNVDISVENSIIKADDVVTKEEIINNENIQANSIITDNTEASNHIDKMGNVDFTTDKILKIDNQYDATNNGVTDKSEYIFVTTNSNDKNIYLLGEGAEDFTDYDSRDITITFDNEINYKGIIVSKGSTYIMGSLNFEGIILSYENIYFDNIGTKNIKNNKRVIYNMIDDDQIKTEFNMDNAEQKGSIVSIDYSLTTPSGINTERLVEIKDWNIIR